MQILDRRKFLFPDYLIWNAVIHHMHHIEHQCLKLVAIWFIRLYLISLLIHKRDLLFHDMDRHMPVCDLLQFIFPEQII